MMKQAFLKGMLRVGGFAAFRRANRHNVLIITYHRFSQAEETLNTTSARALSEQLEYLTKHYTVHSLQAIAERLERNESLPSRAAVITIDDGYRDAYQVAYPILRRYQVPATVFVPTDFLDRKLWLWTDKLRFLTAHAKQQSPEVVVKDRRMRLDLANPESRLKAATQVNSVLKSLPDEEKEAEISNIAATLGVTLLSLPPSEYEPLTWEEAREMDAGGVAIESHTVTHPILTKIGEEQLRYELRQSRSRLQAMLGKEASLFCYPNGSYDFRVRQGVESAGYKCAVSTAHGLNNRRSDVFALRRIHTESDLPHFVQSTSGFEVLKERLRGRSADGALGHDY